MVNQKIAASALCIFVFVVNSVNVNATTVFAEQITLDDGLDTTLNLTGVATRKKFSLDIYRVAHYSDQAETESSRQDTHAIIDNILNSNHNKQLSLVFQRPLRAEQIQKALTRGVNKNCMGDEAARVKGVLEQFREVINRDVVKDDEFSLRWAKNGTLTAFFQGETIGTFESPLLAKLLWSIWFGEKSVIERTDLVRQLDSTADSTQ